MFVESTTEGMPSFLNNILNIGWIFFSLYTCARSTKPEAHKLF